MTFTISLPALVGLAFAALIGYVWIGISCEEGAGINPAVSFLLVLLSQGVTFFFMYGLFAIFGM